ncbi:ion channel [Vibrio chemaguriensis]
MSINLRKIYKIFIIFIAAPFAFFYLFVLPALVASKANEISAFDIGFAAFLTIQLWMLIAEFAFESAATLYGFKRGRLFPFLDLHEFKTGKPQSRITSGFGVLFLAFISYLFMVYGYGVIYVFISNLDSDAFSAADLSVIDGVYFSLITSSTVGYGDITPKSSLSKLVVMSQIIISMFYVLMLFSSAVSYIRESQPSEP